MKLSEIADFKDEANGMIMSFDSCGVIGAKGKENTAHAFDVLHACVFVCPYCTCL